MTRSGAVNDWTLVAHVPRFMIERRGTFTKFYTCKRCGAKVTATNLRRARSFHAALVFKRLKAIADAAVAALEKELAE